MARTDKFIQKTDAFMDRTEMKLQNHDATLKSLETQVGQISQLLSNRQIGGFPSDTEVAKGATHEQCKAITTRSGRILKNKEGTAVNPSPATDTPVTADAPAKIDEDHNILLPTTVENSAETSTARSKEPVEKRPPPPFPQRLKSQKQDYQFKKFLDILKQVHINLPLVEALQQMPNYAKFLKDMVTRKKRVEEFETAAATETCLALMHNKVPAKKTDPGSFTINCLIGHNYPTKALCDPGASINLTPKSVFQKLGIKEAKPTTVMLQLADHSYVQPEGKIEDILVQVDKFIFPADFLILDCEADEYAPIILGRPFLSTNYDDTFSPLAMFKSIRILLAIAAFHDYEIWQMDVKTAFLNGKLEEDVYMTQPEGFATPENAGKVCKLQRSIYGLKQASRSWNLRFNDAIKEFGFIRNEDEPCVYKKFSGSIVSFLILPGLSYALSMTSRYQANPGEDHWTAVKNILKYLRRTKDVFLVYEGEEELGVVSWKSSMQNTVADSRTKTEYVSASEATKETVWIKEFIPELRVIISIANDAIAQAKEPKSHRRSKHTFKRFYLIR
ncbi:hypothetical protein GQ457_14G014490 [Hibiscus cannabinus]